jgi:tetratricopeptide (TPR) repeat protein
LPEHRERRRVIAAMAIIVAAVMLAYANSLRGPFVYDDVPAITENATLRHWWRIDDVLFPPADSTVSGRPILNFSFALNYAVSGTEVWSYHVFNVVIHALAALALFGLVRRTCRLAFALNASERRCILPTGVENDTAVAFAIALLWALHPLATEAVDYIVQRAEALMAMFLLLTLYAFSRAAAAPGRTARSWWVVSVVACMLGMATKENMAAAPVLVLLYDRAFVSGSFGQALRRRKWYFTTLAATWVVLVALIISTGGNRNGTVGFNAGVSPWAYWLTQPPALLRYLALSIWPAPLIFDYGTPWVSGVGEVWFQILVIAALLTVTAIALVKNRPAGFLGAGAFAILAPTSIVPGVAQMIVEHRMYLPLAAIVALAVLGAWRLFGRRTLIGVIGVALVLLGLTAARNTAYRTEAQLWTDTAAKRPDNARAYFMLAKGLQEQGRVRDSLPLYEKAIVLFPAYVEAHTNLGNALVQLGRNAEALRHYEIAAQTAPRSAVVQNNLGNALTAMGRAAEAISHYQQAVTLDPGYRDAYLNLGAGLMQLNRPADAVAPCEHALALAPARTDAQRALAEALAHAGRVRESLSHFEAALRGEPGNAEMHAMYGNALADVDRLADALSEFDRAAALRPDSVVIQYNYAATLLAAGRIADAKQRFETIVKLDPQFAPARAALEEIRRADR